MFEKIDFYFQYIMRFFLYSKCFFTINHFHDFSVEVKMCDCPYLDALRHVYDLSHLSVQ